MQNNKIQVNGIEVTCYVDGSVEWEHAQWGGRLHRTFGCMDTEYMRVKINGTQFLVHRLIAEAFFPDFHSHLDVDHVSGEKRVNSFENLRMATRSENARAFRSTSKGSSEYRGVSKTQNGRWRAYAKVGGKQISLGTFDMELSAAVAFDTFAKENGFFDESLNFKD